MIAPPKRRRGSDGATKKEPGPTGKPTPKDWPHAPLRFPVLLYRLHMSWLLAGSH